MTQFERRPFDDLIQSYCVELSDMRHFELRPTSLFEHMSQFAEQEGFQVNHDLQTFQFDKATHGVAAEFREKVEHNLSRLVVTNLDLIEHGVRTIVNLLDRDTQNLQLVKDAIAAGNMKVEYLKRDYLRSIPRDVLSDIWQLLWQKYRFINGFTLFVNDQVFAWHLNMDDKEM
jgi:archaellum component FlaD/FlaE